MFKLFGGGRQQGRTACAIVAQNVKIAELHERIEILSEKLIESEKKRMKANEIGNTAICDLLKVTHERDDLRAKLATAERHKQLFCDEMNVYKKGCAVVEKQRDELQAELEAAKKEISRIVEIDKYRGETSNGRKFACE